MSVDGQQVSPMAFPSQKLKASAGVHDVDGADVNLTLSYEGISTDYSSTQNNDLNYFLIASDSHTILQPISWHTLRAKNQ